MTGSEYSNEVPYLRTFSNDLSPPVLRLVAAMNGYKPPPALDFDYCEIGCGNGDTTATLAAANPESRFVGIDISSEHVTFANGLAMRGGLSNVAFLDRDFEGMIGDDLPSFHYICAHGFLSWVSQAKRKAFIEVCSQKLAPGGLLYVGYNALPGWAGLSPLRRLIQDGAATVDGDMLEKASRGLALAKLLRDAGTGYVEANPTAKAMVDTMAKAGLPYVVHEYLQPHWHPMYFADVAREMAESDLHFVGQLPLTLNYRNLSLGPVLVELTKTVTDRFVYESLKDFALNELFRRDVYIKGPGVRSDTTAREYLDGNLFGSFRTTDKTKRQLPLPYATLELTGPVYDVLIPALCERASTVSELLHRSALAGVSPEQLREALLYLLLADHAFPMREPSRPSGPADAGIHHFTLPYNRMVVKQRLTTKTPTVLAVPAAGAGLPITMIEAVCLRMVTEIPEKERPAWIRSFVARQPLKLFVHDKPVETAEDQARVLSAELSQFCERRLPKLRELGILEKAE